MADKAWKAFERRMAKIWGGVRRGAHTSDGKSGKNDIIVEGWSVECKLLSRPTYGQMFNACSQAESNMEESNDIPVAVIKKNWVLIRQYDLISLTDQLIFPWVSF